MNSRSDSPPESVRIFYRWWTLFFLVFPAFSVYAETLRASKGTSTLFSTLFVGLFAFAITFHFIKYKLQPIIVFTKDGVFYQKKHFFPWHAVSKFSRPNQGENSVKLWIEIDVKLGQKKQPSAFFDHIFLDGLYTYGRLQIKKLHTIPESSEHLLLKNLESLQKSYYEDKLKESVVFLSAEAKSGLLNLQLAIDSAEKAFKEGIIDFNELSKEKRSCESQMAFLRKTYLPEHLRDLYKDIPLGALKSNSHHS